LGSSLWLQSGEEDKDAYHESEARQKFQRAAKYFQGEEEAAEGTEEEPAAQVV
jgi:hypothetical protein